MRRRVVVTDVTEMGSGWYCVAGWDAAAGRMVRPLSAPGKHWGREWIGPLGLWPGNAADFEDGGTPAISRAPHAREDRLVVPGSMRILRSGEGAGWLRQVAGSVSASMQAAFGHAVAFEQEGDNRFRPRIAPGTDCPSLGAVVIPAGRLRLFVNAKGSLRACLREGGACWYLPVVGHAIRATWRIEGIARAQALLGSGRLHVRLGLARADAARGIEDCYVMLNGAYPCGS